MEHPYPATISKIEKFGYDPKQLHHILRLSEFALRYINGVNYKDCLISKNKDYLIRVKKGEEHDLEQARFLAKHYCDKLGTVVKEYMKQYPLKVDDEVNVILTNVLRNILKIRFRDEILS